jgi:MFS family permease
MWLLVFANHLLVAGAAAAALGVGFVLGVPAYLALISERGEGNRRGEVIGTTGMVQSLGAVLGAVVGNHLYHGGSWAIGSVSLSAHRAPFAVSAALLTISAGLSVAFVRDRQGGGLVDG